MSHVPQSPPDWSAQVLEAEHPPGSGDITRTSSGPLLGSRLNGGPRPVDEELAAFCDRGWDVLVPSRASYLANVSAHYDEVLHEVARRTEHTGSLGKTDIAALVVWKRLSAQTRWVTELMSLPDTHVRAITERAVTAVRDTTLPRSEAARTARHHLGTARLRTGDALASAILTAAAPQRMAVCDRPRPTRP